ncbi:hypothetical protein Tco_0936814 [Tanacetum coccineum]|uniref:Reverse transcriptase domain-containing protein n=1 Tax=Tanacetum coccineum TaxID=301880 RepID=A0ABQ5DD73_9ASTR
MRTRSSSNLVGGTSTNPNPKGRNRRRSKQRVEPFNLEEPIENQAPPVFTMADQRTMAQLLQAQNKQFFGHDKEDPHAHIRYFNKITSTMKFPNVPNSLNSAAGGNFLDKIPRYCLRIIESKSKVRYSRSKAIVAKVSTSSSTPGVSPDVAKLEDMVKALLLDKKSPALTTVKAVEESCVTCGGTHSHRNCPATDGNVYRDNI